MIVNEIELGTHPVAPASYSGTYYPTQQELFGLDGFKDNLPAIAMGVALLSAGAYAMTGMRKGKKNTMNNVLLGGIGLGLGTVGALKFYELATQE